MNEIIRAVFRHERTLIKWSGQLSREFAKQHKLNKRFSRWLAALSIGLIMEDYNLYKTDQKVKELENALDEAIAKKAENEE